MKRLAIAIYAALISPVAFASGNTAINPGSLSTTGATLDHNSLFAGTSNPAMAELMVSPGERFRMNYFIGAGSNFEIGDANDFIDKLEELIDIIDDPDLATGSAQETLDEFNVVLETAGEQGYLKNSTHLALPGLPVYLKPSFMQGTVYFEAAVDTQWRLGFLDSPLNYDSQTGSFSTASSLYIKSGIQQRLSMGYSRDLFEELSLNGVNGRLLAGVQFNLYKMQLSKQLFLLQELGNDGIENTAQEQYDNNLSSSSGFGVDAGLVWDANWYRLGLTVTDINSPEFEYGDLGVNCGGFEDASTSRSNCEVTPAFTSEINANEVHTKHASARTDATVFPMHNWSVSGSLDLAAYDDIVGTENQWASLSTAYTPSNIYIPALRVGFHKNLAGSELTSLGFGLTFFKTFNFDLATSTQTVDYDGASAPRRFSFSLSFEESF